MKRLYISLIAAQLLTGSVFGQTTPTEAIETEFPKDCRDFYSDNRWVGNEGYTLGFGTSTLAGLIIGGGISAVAIIPGVMIPITAFVAPLVIHNYKQDKMIDLIDDAESYLFDGGVPGKRLEKLYKQLPKESRPTMLEVATLISQANDDLSLCSSSSTIYARRLRQAIEDGTIRILK